MERTVVLTYAEFGRPKENISGGTDHGTANVQFALGGRVAAAFTVRRRICRACPETAIRPTHSISRRLCRDPRQLRGVDSRAVLRGNSPRSRSSRPD
jgi:hypothetical protein